MSEGKWQTLATGASVVTHFPKWKDRIAVFFGKPITINVEYEVQVYTKDPVRQSVRFT